MLGLLLHKSTQKKQKKCSQMGQTKKYLKKLFMAAKE
jgi:hypothetical protein